MTHSINWRDELRKGETVLLNVVERKVKAATTAATLTGVVANLISLYVLHGTVPDWITVLIGSAVTGLLTFVAGFCAKHTPRTLPTTSSPDAPTAGQ